MESLPRVAGERAPEAGRWGPPPSPALRRAGRPPLPRSVNLACFLLTVATTLIGGALFTLNDLSFATALDVVLSPSLWTLGLSYSLSLILILGAHEMGHYVACRIYGIDATLPFFIPGPPLFGTFGAVIRIRSPFTTRRALFDVGVAGPIAGFVVALPVLAWGLMHSQVVPAEPKPGDIGFPPCLLLVLAYEYFHPGLAPDTTIAFHPTVIAAWVGLLATFLNLLPIGQLDGGHILYALSRRAHRAVSMAWIVLLIASGLLFNGAHLILFGVLWAVIGPGHPAVVDESEGLGPVRVLVAALAGGILALCFIPTSPRLF